jgi:hypothetical protein
MAFSEDDHRALATLFGAGHNYAGYKPAEREAPNSDGRVDEGKRYLHVALKYDPPEWAVEYLARAHWEACRVAEALRVPDAFYPRVENGTLRVLEYPAGAGSAEHTDFDLFTILCWRSTPEDLELTHAGRGDYAPTAGPDTIDAARAIDPHLHIGRIGELVGLGPATPHRVPARPYAQKALVYFAMPAMAARFPLTDPLSGWGGTTVREWLDDVYAKSRMYA